MTKYDERHGGPWDRGSMDSYYRRTPCPHYFIGDTGLSELVEKEKMSKEQIEAYWAGYDDNEQCGDFKDW